MKASNQSTPVKKQGKQKKNIKSIVNVINSFPRRILKMDLLSFLYHDSIIRASASTYAPEILAREGLQITLNLNSQKTRYVGNATNPIYPEIIIWRPDYQGATTGQAVIVEAIETVNTLSIPPIYKWRVLASLGIRFNLIVPLENLQQTKDILAANQLRTGITIQTYRLDRTQNRYIFTTI